VEKEGGVTVMGKYIGTGEAVRLSGASEGAVKGWIHHKSVKAEKVNGRWQIDRDSLMQHLEVRGGLVLPPAPNGEIWVRSIDIADSAGYSITGLQAVIRRGKVRAEKGKCDIRNRDTWFVDLRDLERFIGRKITYPALDGLPRQMELFDNAA
jgi:hypothetical protein